ncbi:hypothetical protein OUZ56_023123 [Daphnia magna]|uniref:Uncharacterized protein n=1 Tax=Daphnia magna TaxID=35525 RepID=A0ABR0AYC4_9CRUS|nr:hypothetical protein OUZ56_023123 [Daphnia magna]
MLISVDSCNVLSVLQANQIVKEEVPNIKAGYSFGCFLLCRPIRVADCDGHEDDKTSAKIDKKFCFVF